MEFFTEKDKEWMKAHGLTRPESFKGEDVDFCQGDIGLLHVEARLFKSKRYETMITNTFTKVWTTGRGYSLQSALDNAVELLEKREKDISSLINSIKDWEKD